MINNIRFFGISLTFDASSLFFKNQIFDFRNFNFGTIKEISLDGEDYKADVFILEKSAFDFLPNLETLSLISFKFTKILANTFQLQETTLH